LFITCSPKGPASVSVTFAQELLARLRQHYPDASSLSELICLGSSSAC
jgi:hypothetical protein